MIKHVHMLVARVRTVQKLRHKLPNQQYLCAELSHWDGSLSGESGVFMVVEGMIWRHTTQSIHSEGLIDGNELLLSAFFYDYYDDYD